MSKKEEFIKYVENTLSSYEMNDEAKAYWEALIDKEETEKPMFTDNGKIILMFLQNNASTEMWKAKTISEEMGISSRTVSGAMRKLVTDGFVEKIGKDPIMYSITEKGKNIEIN